MLTVRSHTLILILLASISGALPTAGTLPETPAPPSPPPSPFPDAILALPDPLHFRSLTQHPNLLQTRQDESGESAKVVLSISVNRNQQPSLYWMSLELDPSSTLTASTSGTLYTSTGRHFTFTSRKSRLQSMLVGPIPNKIHSSPRTRKFSFVVNDDYLRLGLHRLDEFFEATQRFRARFPDHAPMEYTIRSTPFEDTTALFPDEVIDAAQLSEASERAFVGAIPALTEFFGIIYETDGLKDILLSLIPKSKLVKLLLPFSNAQIRMQYGTPRPHRSDAAALQIGIPTVGVVPLQVFIGNEPMLDLTLYTTEPSYEWQASAGMVAASIRSIPEPDRHCMVRVFPATLLAGRINDTRPSLE